MGSAPNENLLLLKLPRTGSTYLAHILRQHPRLTMHHEYLNKHTARRVSLMKGPLGIRGVRRLTNSVLRKAKWRDLGQLLASSSESQITGASVNPLKEQMAEPDLRQIVNTGTRIIVLTRKNLLKQHISHLNVSAEQEAGAKMPYKSYRHDGQTTQRKFFISPDAVSSIEKLDRNRERILTMVEKLDNPKLFITYEEHINVNEKEPVLRAFAEFLDIEYPDIWPTDDQPAEDAPRYHKLVSDDLRDVIENYDDIASNPVLAKFL
jgi:hypothetical protein